MPSQFHFYEDTLNQLNGVLTSYVSDVASNIIDAIAPMATTLLMIYVMLWGWTMMRGMIQEPVLDGASRLIRLSVVCGIALSLGRYNGYLSDFLWNTPDALASYVAPDSDSAKNVQFLDSLMSRCYDIGDAYWQKANASGGMLPDVGLLITAILIWAAGLIATAYGAFLLIISKVALAIILGIGPIFVLLLIFEGTKRFFESWMGQALKYVFLVALTAGTIKLVLTILGKYLDAANKAGVMADPSISQALPAIAICIISALVMMQLGSIATALGSGTAVGTLDAAAWTYGKAKGGTVVVRPANATRNDDRARVNVRVVNSAAKATTPAPMSVYRKVTQSRPNRVTRTGA